MEGSKQAVQPSDKESQTSTVRQSNSFFDQHAPRRTPDRSTNDDRGESDKLESAETVLPKTFQHDSGKSMAEHLEDAAKTLRDVQDPSSRLRQDAEQSLLRLPPLKAPLDPYGWARLQAQVLIHSTFDLARKDPPSGASSLPRNLLFSSPDETAHDDMDAFVEDVADLVHANVIRLDANDIAELAGDYIDATSQASGTISSLAYDAYDGAAAAQIREGVMTMPGGGHAESDEPHPSMHGEDFESESPSLPGLNNLQDLKSLINANRNLLSKALGGAKILGVSVGPHLQGMPMQAPQSQSQEKSSKEDRRALDDWQELKLEAFVDNILNSANLAKESGRIKAPDSFLRQKFALNPKLSADLIPGYAHDSLRLQLAHHLKNTFASVRGIGAFPQGHDSDVLTPSDGPITGTIVHVRDVDRIVDTPQGEALIRRLTKVISRRRKGGERILVVGTSCGATTSMLTAHEAALDEDSGFNTIEYPSSSVNLADMRQLDNKPTIDKPNYPIRHAYRRLVEINLRNIQDAIRRLGVPHSDTLFREGHHKYLYLPGMQKLGDFAFTPEEVQRLVVFANGFRSLYTCSVTGQEPWDSANNDNLQMIHLALSLTLLDRIERSVNLGKNMTPQSIFNNIQVMDREEKGSKDKKSRGNRPDLDQIRKTSSKHEQRLMTGVRDPDSIKTGFGDVHAQPETVEALKTITSLALIRPEAFSYGVLSRDRLSGLLLYGPPGTGKTLLAKAVAKESGATVLEVSGAQIYEKYVGEGEKMVRAVFSLAKKLSPCVVFIDEADAIFGSRGQSGNRTTHREIINQFLREWDGMDDQGVFMMVATNRPFDLDDAVLRRLPRRLLVDLPVAKDRESILKIHLKDETVDAEVELSTLAERTPFYSGSDLKNVCVAAALSAVREENELLESKKGEEGFKLPERRTLKQSHFDQAIQEISASISEDMSSLTAIKKFDEQYGDRRGRRKKTGYGFGLGGDVAPDESAARVRGDRDTPGR